MAATKPRDLTPAGTLVGTTLSNLWPWERQERKCTQQDVVFTVVFELVRYCGLTVETVNV